MGKRAGARASRGNEQRAQHSAPPAHHPRKQQLSQYGAVRGCTGAPAIHTQGRTVRHAGAPCPTSHSPCVHRGFSTRPRLTPTPAPAHAGPTRAWWARLHHSRATAASPHAAVPAGHAPPWASACTWARAWAEPQKEKGGRQGWRQQHTQRVALHHEHHRGQRQWGCPGPSHLALPRTQAPPAAPA